MDGAAVGGCWLLAVNGCCGGSWEQGDGVPVPRLRKYLVGSTDELFNGKVSLELVFIPLV